MFRRIFALMTLMSVLLMMSACSAGGQDAGDKEKETISETADTAEITEAPETEAKRPDPSPEEASEWASELYSDAMQKLFDEKVLAAPDEAGNIAFTAGDKNEMAVAFEDQVRGEALTAEFTEEPEGLIVCEDGAVFCTPERLRRSDPVPYFFPSGTNGVLIYNTKNTDAFADSLEECDYLAYYRGFESRVDENYYGNAYHRISVTTVVFIIDAGKREIVHIEVVGTDTPGNVTQDNTGKVLYDRAEAYIRGLADR